MTLNPLRNGVDVWQYVKDVLDQLLAGVTDYEPLLPWNWSYAHPEAIGTYRITERQNPHRPASVRSANLAGVAATDRGSP